MNNKGFFTATIAGVYTFFASSGAAMLVASILLKPQHRVRKGVEACVNEGFSKEGCQVYINNMDKADLLDYIRDDGKVKSLTDYSS